MSKKLIQELVKKINRIKIKKLFPSIFFLKKIALSAEGILNKFNIEKRQPKIIKKIPQH